MHEVETMMYVNETPWHGLGTKLTQAPTTREAIVAAGLDWGVTKVALFHHATTGVAQTQIATHVATRRTTDGRILGVVGSDYQPLQNSEAFGFFDPILAAGEATLDTAGSLREGSRVWVLAKLNRDPAVIVPGADDKVEKFVLLSNSHDGSLAVRVGFTPIRVVCANTMAMAHGDKGSSLMRLKHTTNLVENLEAVREVINAADARFEATADQYRALARRDVNGEDLKRYVKLVFASKAVIDLQDKGAEVTAQLEAALVEASERPRLVESITELFEHGRGNDLPGVRGTYWAAYNAVTEYLSYTRGSAANDTADQTAARRARRLDQVWFGQSAALNRRALSEAVRLAA